jgi:hypothetical protein
MEVYGVTWPQDGEGGVARKPTGWWPPAFSGQPVLAEWSAPTFALDGRFVDLQPNDAGVKLFSAEMRRIVDLRKAAIDRIEWLPVIVEQADVRREYAIPHLLDELDVIDRRRSVINPTTGGVVKAHLRADAIGGHRVFTYSNTTGIIILFTEEVFSALHACTGCAFMKVKVSGAAE